MKPWMIAGLLGAWVAALSVFGTLSTRTTAQGEQPVALKVEAPPFQEIEEWINSKPLQIKDLRGQVIVVHFWAFG